MTAVRILIVEDEPLIARNIAMYLRNHDYEVSGVAYDYEDAMFHFKKQPPDFAILDINLEGERDGIDLGRYIQQNLFIPFIYLTSYSDQDTLERAKTTNPQGFIVKPFNEKTLYTTIEIALSNHALFANKHVPELSEEKLNRLLPLALSAREFEVLNQLYAGKTNVQIARELYISINTLKKHINNAYFKMDVATRTAAVAKLRELMLK